jgi:hypothetical protein
MKLPDYLFEKLSEGLEKLNRIEGIEVT